jgi:tagatose-1,6-bisphosphate aldolase
MYKNNAGKLVVYESTGFPSKKRLESVKTAAEQTAKRLNMDFGIVKFGKTGAPLYVYYECDEEEPVPLYCDEGKMAGLEEIDRKSVV